MASRPISRNVKYEKDNIIEGRITRRVLRSAPDSVKKSIFEDYESKPVEKEPDLSKLPSIVFTGKLYFFTKFEECAMICDQIIERIEKNATGKVPIGFDLEWPFSFQTGPGRTALAQLCVSENTCHLFHIYEFKKLPRSLIVLLSHPNVILVGVNIKNDVWKLGRDFPEFPSSRVVDNNCVDCGPFANQVYRRSGRWSLARLTGYLLKKKISKDPKVRNSKWHILPLCEEQKVYAATDAYVSLLLYLTIEKKAEEIKLEEASRANAKNSKDQKIEENFAGNLISNEAL